MKRTIAILATPLALIAALTLATPAQADASDRRLVKSMVMYVLDDLPYSDQETACEGWNSGISYLRKMVYTELTPVVMNDGTFSRYDAQRGIHLGFDSFCHTH